MTAARLTVDLRALRANYRRIAAALRQAAPAAPRPGAVVKADAYGLGAAATAPALAEEGCEHYFVANVAEGVALRGALPGHRIYVLSGPLCAEDASAMAERALVPVLNDEAQARRWQAHRAHPVALHVDTGMHRLGFPNDATRAEGLRGLNVRLLLSHYANADDPAHPANALQAARFKAVAARFPSVPVSLGNSAAALGGAAIGLARPGIALFGGNPFVNRPNPMAVVAALEAQVVGLRDVPAGEPVGYGGSFIACEPLRVAVLGIGYADGLPRRYPNGSVAWRAASLPVVGRVSMDLVQVDASAAADIRLGDWVEIFGHRFSVDDFAARAGTISNEALTSIGRRVPRRYVAGNKAARTP